MTRPSVAVCSGNADVISPERGSSGDAHFNEVFFDDARAPADRIVGKRGEGWIVSRSTLAAERNVVGTADAMENGLGGLIEQARASRRRGRSAIEDPEIRRRLIELEGYVLSHKYSSYRQLTSAARGENPGLIGTMNKLVGTDISTDMARLSLELDGEGCFGAPESTVEMLKGGTSNPVARFVGSLGGHSGGGTTNIQRNIVGEHGLGLPRDSAVLKKRSS